jgi:arylsulfatase A-like enzyme
MTFAISIVVALAAQEGVEHAAAVTVRPGDSPLDHRELLAVAEWPTTNLPPDVAQLARTPFPMRSPKLAASEWTSSPLPEEVASKLPYGTPLLLWRARPSVPRRPDSSPPRLFVGRREAPGFDQLASHGVAPPFVVWDAASASLLAVSETAPKDVSIDFVADPKGELGSHELLFADASGARRPTLDAITRRVERLGVTRSALLVPAGASLSFPVSSLEADTLRVAVALDDVAWRRNGDHLERTSGRSDGAVVAVDAICDGRRQRLAATRVDVHTAAGGFLEWRVPLATLAGRALELRLVTEPGPSGDPWFDYVLWSDLTFEGNARAPERPHVVLVDVDSLRGDVFDHAAPRLLEWAGRATRWRDALSTAATALPAATSLLTGATAQEHGVLVPGAPTAGALTSLAQRLDEAGYETVGLSDGGVVTAADGFAEGFDRFESGLSLEHATERALDAIRGRRSERPLFLFLHTYVVRPETADPPRAAGANGTAGPGGLVRGAIELTKQDRDYVRAAYDQGVARLDEKLAAFLAQLDAAFGEQDRTVVLTSDHGEAFFEHGLVGHGVSLYDEAVHVPLVVAWPRSVADAPPAGISTAAVSTIDVVPTLLDAVGLPLPSSRELVGRSLRGAVGDAARFAQLSDDVESVTLGGQRLVRRGRGDDRKVELYDLVHDAGELEDVATANAARAKELEAALDELRRRHPQPAPRPAPR